MTIKVRAISSEHPISVVIDGFCNHAGAKEKLIEYLRDSFWPDAGIFVPDETETQPTLVCKCGYREMQDTEWEED